MIVGSLVTTEHACILEIHSIRRQKWGVGFLLSIDRLGNSNKYALGVDEDVSQKIGEICSATSEEMFGSVHRMCRR